MARPVTGTPGNCGPEDLFFTWTCSTLDFGFAGIQQPLHNVGMYPAVARNSADLLFIAHYNATAGDLRWMGQEIRTYLPLTTR
jgi:hypothetical protein